MDLIVGSTGSLGQEICRRSVDRGRDVRGVHRPTSPRESVVALKSLGVELVEADLRDPASMDRACDDIENVITTATGILRADTLQDADLQGQRALIDAAASAGVERLVFVSVGRDLPACPLIDAKRAVESYLTASGLTYTILRPPYFHESWLSPAVGFDYPNAKAAIYGDGRAKNSYVSLGDVAEVALLTLGSTGARNRVIEFGGPDTLSQLDAVRTFEELSGRAFEVEHIPEDALRQQRDATDDPKLKSFTTFMLALADGFVIDNSDAQKIVDLPLTSVRDYARRALAVS